MTQLRRKPMMTRVTKVYLSGMNLQIWTSPFASDRACFYPRYRGTSHDDVFGHLTNSSINKKSPFAAAEKDVIGEGCKWSLKRLQRR